MPNVDEELLTPEGMADAYAALTAMYSWFIHIKPIRKFEKIKSGDLQPRSQGCETNRSVARSIGGLVANVNEMIFLRPLGIGVVDSTPRRGEQMFKMAVPSSALPSIVTVDWTMDGNWGLASIIKDYEPCRHRADIFCEVVTRRGSVAIYETLPANLLRVWTAGVQEDNPASWPRLLDTELANVMAFD